MKFLSFVMLSFLLVACGKGGSGGGTKVIKKSLSEQNALLADQGVAVGLGPVAGAVGDHVIVLCYDELVTAPETTNDDRVRSLQEYKDRIRNMDSIRFTDGTMVDVGRVELAISSAISKLQTKLYEKSCPDRVIGKTRI